MVLVPSNPPCGLGGSKQPPLNPAGRLIILSSRELFWLAVAGLPQEWESALWDDLEMTGGSPNIDGQFAIDVLDIDHPLSGNDRAEPAGGTGHPRGCRYYVTRGENHAGLAPAATVVAQQVGGGAPLIAVVDEGGELRDGSLTAAVRIGLFFGDQGLDGVTPEGVAIFDGAVRYALGDTVGGPAIQPGDADQDLDFDQLDIVKVQIAAKYLTGQTATWGEGDWDGGPGGQPGSPPVGNGRFDQSESSVIVASH